jgi:hypothetical protein
MNIGVRQNQSGTDTARRAHRAEQVCPPKPLITRRSRAGAALCPNPGQAALLADPRFVLPPKFDRLVSRGGRNRCGNKISEVFLVPVCRQHEPVGAASIATFS